MENPAQEIAHVVRSLTMGSPQQQQDTISAHFLPDASYTHPFCRVPSFPRGAVPLAPCTDSRALVLAMYRWYRTLSPRIQLSVESAVFDDRTGLLYLSIHQIFSLWFLPFHKADVQLVSVLHLVRRASPEAEPAPDGSAMGAQPAEQKLKQKEDQEQEYAQEETQEFKQEKSQEQTREKKPDKKQKERQHQRKATQRPPQQQQQQQLKYYIASQQDLYQVNDLLKFVAPPFIPLLLCFLQLFGTVLCVVGSIVLRPLYHFMNDVSDREIGIEL